MAGAGLQILLLLLVSNAAPILTARLFGSLGTWPIDLGRSLPDGQPLFGSSKTWRGLIAVLVTACVSAWYLGLGVRFGLIFGLLIITGDLLSSFCKRRMSVPPSGQCLGLDQLPESLIPVLYAVPAVGIPWWWVIVLPLAFMVIELLVSPPLYWLKIRKRPY